MLTILYWVQAIVGGIAIGGFMWRRLGEHRRIVRHRGRHVSKKLGRLVGFERVSDIETGLLLAWILLLAANWISGASVLLIFARLCGICWNAWLADDVWFTDDDMRKRWDGVKARLRKCKPVMKRAVQRWKPQPRRVPVPA